MGNLTMRPFITRLGIKFRHCKEHAWRAMWHPFLFAVIARSERSERRGNPFFLKAGSPRGAKNAPLAMTIVLIMFLVYWCSGCVHTIDRYPQPVTLATTLENQRKISQLAHWKIIGTISVTHRGTRNVVRFRWIQRADDYQIYLFGPLNMGSIKIIGNSYGAELINGDDYIKATTLEQLLEKQFGYRLPGNVMRHWILGLRYVGAAKIYSENHKNYQINFGDYYYNYEKEVFLARTIEIFHKATQIKIKISGHHFFN